MRLSEIYVKEVLLKEFWRGLEEDLIIEESDSGLKELIGRANEIIFQKFNINPTDKVYSIVGSARLYLYPTLREAFGLSGTIGDLDMVIPNKELWINAGLEENWNKGGIYRPTDDGSIEAFNVWDPAKAGGRYADVQVRSTPQIISSSTLINGYYFMSLEDIMDYKTKLGRDKEKEVVSLIDQYQKSNVNNKKEFIKRIVRLIGVDKTKEFLGIVKEDVEEKKPISTKYLKGLLNNVQNNLAKKYLTKWINKGVNDVVQLSPREHNLLLIIQRGGIIPQNFTTKN